jgi:hypothetical protein
LFIDQCLDADSQHFWEAAAAALPSFSKTAQVAVGGALLAASSDGALSFKALLAQSTNDPALRRLMQFGTPGPSVHGEWARGPRPVWVLIAQAVCGWLLLAGLWRIVTRFVLAGRHPAELSISAAGLQVTVQSRLLGRTLRSRTWITPLAEIVFLSRETRFARAGLYSGLLALAVGTYVGTGMVFDGLRVPGGSPSLLGFGLLVIIGGLLVDLLLSAIDRLGRQKSKLVICTRQRRNFALSGVSPEQVDLWLERASTLRGLSS